MHSQTCPWCGRWKQVTRKGAMYRHDSNERSLGGRRLECRGSGKNPAELLGEEELKLRERWCDDEGWRLSIVDRWRI